jgi:fatty acid desaturase
MKDKLRDIAFLHALGMILAGLWLEFGFAPALLVFGILLLWLLMRGHLFPAERRR